MAGCGRGRDVDSLQATLAQFRGWNDGSEFTPLRKPRDVPLHCIDSSSQLLPNIASLVRAAHLHGVCRNTVFRPVSPADLTAVVSLNQINDATFEGCLNDKSDYMIVAVREGTIVGFVSYYLCWFRPRGDADGVRDGADDGEAGNRSTAAATRALALAPPQPPSPAVAMESIQVIYIAVVQVARATTHGAGCVEAEAGTGSLLLSLALRHAALAGVSAAVLDATPSSVQFYERKYVLLIVCVRVCVGKGVGVGRCEAKENGVVCTEKSSVHPRACAGVPMDRECVHLDCTLPPG